jgi:hypothetical protein
LLRLESKHRGVFCEVYAAPVAFAAVILNVPAGGTGKAEGGMAARAELRPFGVFMTALGASHGAPISPI